MTGLGQGPQEAPRCIEARQTRQQHWCSSERQSSGRPGLCFLGSKQKSPSLRNAARPVSPCEALGKFLLWCGTGRKEPPAIAARVDSKAQVCTVLSRSRGARQTPLPASRQLKEPQAFHNARPGQRVSSLLPAIQAATRAGRLRASPRKRATKLGTELQMLCLQRPDPAFWPNSSKISNQPKVTTR